MKLEQAARQLLRSFESGMIDINLITALREALEHPEQNWPSGGEANEMVGCAYCNNPLFAGTKCNNCGQVTLAEQAEPKCNPHPDAPHGFDRNASHSANRYVCECEGWEPEQAEQEPVFYHAVDKFGCNKFYYLDEDRPTDAIPLYAAPVRTKDLTDEELNTLWHNTKGGWLGLFRAVIAADREKNRG